MDYRTLGKTNFKISEVSLGTWQLGSKWGNPFDADDAARTLEAAYESGVNCFDTADIYQDGLSEHAVGQFLKKHPDVHYSTKMGRRIEPHSAANYSKQNLMSFVDHSLKNMQVDALDLVLLHCPPTSVYDDPEVFQTLDDLKRMGKIRNYGVSVERVAEAITALQYDISAVEIIFNMFRLRPATEFFAKAQAANVGILARVPLASGLLSGKYTAQTTFGKNDHRTFNRHGEAFDKGETFSGVDFETGLKAVDELKRRLKTDDLAPMALRYILMYDAVSAVIPGASKPEQITANAAAAERPPFTDAQMQIVRDVYDNYIKDSVENLW